LFIRAVGLAHRILTGIKPCD